MHNFKGVKPTVMKGIKSYEGESIEQKVARILSNKEPLTDGAVPIYTTRKEGVKPEYNIRTDKMEIAVEGMSGVSKANLAKRDQGIGERAKEGMKKEGGETTSTQGTGDNK